MKSTFLETYLSRALYAFDDFIPNTIPYFKITVKQSDNTIILKTVITKLLDNLLEIE
ncbi:hypothetical protein GCM10022259_24090 [Aquimarina mytili]